MIIDRLDKNFPKLNRGGQLRVVSQLAYELIVESLEKNGLQDVAFYAGDYIKDGLTDWVNDTLGKTDMTIEIGDLNGQFDTQS